MNPDIKTKLEEHLGRPANPHEVINAQNDALLLVRALQDRISNFEARLSKLEKPKI